MKSALIMALLNKDNLRFVALVVAIVIIAQLLSIPISEQLQKEGLPR